MSEAFVTGVAAVLGVVILVVGIFKFYNTGAADTEKWPIIGVLAVGAFLLVGSQYKSFKVSATGLEALRNDVATAAEAASTVAAQAEQTATAVQETQAQVNGLTESLLQNRAFSPTIAAPMRARLQSAQRIDIDRLRAAQRVLNRIEAK